MIQIPKSVEAQQIMISGQSFSGPLVGINTLGDLTNKILSFLIPFAALLLLGVFLWGGIDFLTSGGIPDKVKKAQAKITAGLIGFGLLIASYVIVRLVSYIFQLPAGMF